MVARYRGILKKMFYFLLQMWEIPFVDRQKKKKTLGGVLIVARPRFWRAPLPQQSFFKRDEPVMVPNDQVI